jgi:hypothetical protein
VIDSSSASSFASAAIAAACAAAFAVSCAICAGVLTSGVILSFQFCDLFLKLFHAGRQLFVLVSKVVQKLGLLWSHARSLGRSFNATDLLCSTGSSFAADSTNRRRQFNSFNSRFIAVIMFCCTPSLFRIECISDLLDESTSVRLG